jgi:hypothetical protein
MSTKKATVPKNTAPKKATVPKNTAPKKATVPKKAPRKSVASKKIDIPAASSDSIICLPIDMVAYIISFLTLDQILTVSLTCKYFYELSKNEKVWFHKVNSLKKISTCPYGTWLETYKRLTGNYEAPLNFPPNLSRTISSAYTCVICSKDEKTLCTHSHHMYSPAASDYSGNLLIVRSKYNGTGDDIYIFNTEGKIINTIRDRFLIGQIIFGGENDDIYYTSYQDTKIYYLKNNNGNYSETIIDFSEIVGENAIIRIGQIGYSSKKKKLFVVVRNISINSYTYMLYTIDPTTISYDYKYKIILNSGWYESKFYLSPDETKIYILRKNRIYSIDFCKNISSDIKYTVNQDFEITYEEFGIRSDKYDRIEHVIPLRNGRFLCGSHFSKDIILVIPPKNKGGKATNRYLKLENLPQGMSTFTFNRQTGEIIQCQVTVNWYK